MAAQPVRNVTDLIAGGNVASPTQPLSPEQKEELATNGTEIIVTEIQYGNDGEFGPFWEFNAEIDGEPTVFRLSSHARRDVFIQSLAAALPQGPIGGLRLTAYKGRGANQFINLEPRT